MPPRPTSNSHFPHAHDVIIKTSFLDASSIYAPHAALDTNAKRFDLTTAGEYLHFDAKHWIECMKNLDNSARCTVEIKKCSRGILILQLSKSLLHN